MLDMRDEISCATNHQQPPNGPYSAHAKDHSPPLRTSHERYQRQKRIMSCLKPKALTLKVKRDKACTEVGFKDESEEDVFWTGQRELSEHEGRVSVEWMHPYSQGFIRVDKDASCEHVCTRDLEIRTWDPQKLFTLGVRRLHLRSASGKTSLDNWRQLSQIGNICLIVDIVLQIRATVCTL